MIQPLRSRHQRIILSLTIVLPVLFIAGVLAPRPIPVMERVPTDQPPLSQALSRELWADDNLWPTLNIRTRIFASRTDSMALTLELQPRAYAKIADILVYWQTEEGQEGQLQTTESYLLGTLSTTQTGSFALPQQATREDGVVVLFSLARQQVIATANLTTQTILTRRAE